MAELPVIPTRLPEVPSESMPKLADSHRPSIPGSGWDIYREDVMTGMLRANLAGFIKEFYGEATETEAHDDSAVPGLLKYDGVPPAREGITAGATAFNTQRLAYIRRLKALTMSVLKQTLTAEQRISCSPPGVADAHDVDALWERIKTYVQGADSDNLAENIEPSVRAPTRVGLAQRRATRVVHAVGFELRRRRARPQITGRIRGRFPGSGRDHSSVRQNSSCCHQHVPGRGRMGQQGRQAG